MKDNIIKDSFILLTDLVLLNFLWLVVSGLGIFLSAGAATTAMFSVSFKLVQSKKHTYIVKDFFDSFLKNLVPSTIAWGLILLISFPLYLIYNYSINTGNTVLMVSVFIAAFEVLIFTVYIFPIIARFEGKTVTLMKNAILLGHIHFFTTFKVLGSLALVLLLVVRVNSFFLLVMVGIYAGLSTFHLKQIFNIYIQKIVGEDNELPDF